MILFGNKQTFAFAVAPLVGAPDEGDPSAAATWAELQIWVNGENFTRHVDTNRQSVHDGLSWPVIHLARWLVANWAELFHAHRWPVSSARNPRDVCLNLNVRVADSLDLDDESIEESIIEERDRFVFGHSLAAAAAGALTPDLYFARDGNRVSVGIGPSRTHPSIWFQHTAGEADVDVASFLEAAIGVVRWVVQHLSHVPAPLAEVERARFEQWLSSVDSPEAAEVTLASYMGLEPLQLRELFSSEFDLELPANWRSQGAAFDPSQCGTAIVFRALAPTLSVDDVRGIVERLRSVPPQPGASKKLSEHAARLPSPTGRHDHEQGYAAAIAFREAIGNEDSYLDIESLLAEWNVPITDLEISDPSVDGGATWDSGHGPMLFVNPKSLRANTQWGRRMVLAHEVCHLLLDHSAAVPLRIISGEWSPPLVERRANAFAAEVLLPRAGVVRICKRAPQTLPPEAELNALMKEFGVGATTVFEHLHNRFRLPRDS